jgi:hypothetical protein
LDSRAEGNRSSEAYRQNHLRDGSEPPGHSASERRGGPESAKPRRPSPQPWGEGSMGSRKLAETAVPLRRGGSDGMVARARRATGEALLAPGRNPWKRVGPYNQRHWEVGSKARGWRRGPYERRTGVMPGERRDPAAGVPPSKREAGTG